MIENIIEKTIVTLFKSLIISYKKNLVFYSKISPVENLLYCNRYDYPINLKVFVLKKWL